MQFANHYNFSVCRSEGLFTDYISLILRDNDPFLPPLSAIFITKLTTPLIIIHGRHLLNPPIHLASIFISFQWNGSWVVASIRLYVCVSVCWCHAIGVSDVQFSRPCSEDEDEDENEDEDEDEDDNDWASVRACEYLWVLVSVNNYLWKPTTKKRI